MSVDITKASSNKDESPDSQGISCHIFRITKSASPFPDSSPYCEVNSKKRNNLLTPTQLARICCTEALANNVQRRYGITKASLCQELG